MFSKPPWNKQDEYKGKPWPLGPKWGGIGLNQLGLRVWLASLFPNQVDPKPGGPLSMGSKKSKVESRALGETNSFDSFCFWRRGHIYVFSSNKKKSFSFLKTRLFFECPLFGAILIKPKPMFSKFPWNKKDKYKRKPWPLGPKWGAWVWINLG